MLSQDQTKYRTGSIFLLNKKFKDICINTENWDVSDFDVNQIFKNKEASCLQEYELELASEFVR